MFEMKPTNDREVRLARKRTSIISNSQALLKELTKVPAKWKTPTCHDAGVEDRSMPDVQR